MRISPDTSWGAVDGELVLLGYETGIYYGLNQVGAHIWRLLAENLTVPQVIERIQASYAVDPDVAAREVQRLITELHSQGLLIDGPPDEILDATAQRE